MTITNLLKQSGVKYTRNDAGKIGMLIRNKAEEKKVRYTKKDEVVQVNDYPETFVEEMQQVAIDYFTSKKPKA